MFSYLGGKKFQAKWIADHFPEFDNYIEPFGGAMWVYFQSSVNGQLNIYNDFLQNTQNAGLLPVLRMLNAKYLVLPDAQKINHPDIFLVKRGSLRTSRGELPAAIYKINNYLPTLKYLKPCIFIFEAE